MSNYPNMSYCMCENTLLALHQVVAAVSYNFPKQYQSMSREEQRAFDQLVMLCRDFAEEYSTLNGYADDREVDF
jgi:hypothetical protein